MAVRTNTFYKVYEQSHDGDGIGTILASFHGPSGKADAVARATQLAKENSPMRFTVLTQVSTVYADRRGNVQKRDY